MHIQYKGTEYEPTSDVIESASRKIESLGKYLGGAEASAHAYVELGRAVGGQQTGEIWRAELNIDADGARFRAESTKETLEEAVDDAVAEMARELQGAKQRDERKERKEGAKLKDMLRGFWKR